MSLEYTKAYHHPKLKNIWPFKIYWSAQSTVPLLEAPGDLQSKFWFPDGVRRLHVV